MGPEGVRVNSFEEVETKDRMVLFNNRVCPFGHRTWWAMAEKNLELAKDYDYIHIDLGEKKPEWYKRDVNPAGTVPCIYDNGDGIFESAICAEYVEDKYPNQGTALFPGSPGERAAARLVVDTFGNKLMGPLYKLLMNTEPEKDAECVENIQNGLKAIDEQFAKHSGDGPFFLGEKFSFADLCIATFIDRFDATLPYWRGFKLRDEAASERVYKMYDACKERPAFKATSQAPEFYVYFYESYAKKVRALGKE